MQSSFPFYIALITHDTQSWAAFRRSSLRFHSGAAALLHCQHLCPTSDLRAGAHPLPPLPSAGLAMPSQLRSIPADYEVQLSWPSVLRRNWTWQEFRGPFSRIRSGLRGRASAAAPAHVLSHHHGTRRAPRAMIRSRIMAGTTAALKHGINEMSTFPEKVAKT